MSILKESLILIDFARIKPEISFSFKYLYILMLSSKLMSFSLKLLFLLLKLSNEQEAKNFMKGFK
jgi:hypothetical protein